MNSVSNLVSKALLLLDRGDVLRAKECLSNAIDLAQASGDGAFMAQSLVILGDVLLGEGDSKGGEALLRKALALDLGDDELSIVDYELNRARELLGLKMVSFTWVCLRLRLFQVAGVRPR